MNAGVALLKPFGIRGEIGLGGSWARPIDNFHQAPAFWDDLDDQYGLETYWKILLTPDLWITPGVQAIFEPSLNPEDDFIAIRRPTWVIIMIRVVSETRAVAPIEIHHVNFRRLVFP